LGHFSTTTAAAGYGDLAKRVELVDGVPIGAVFGQQRLNF
jgi:hypothetical protein